jgi:hypothetical protein
LTVHLDHAHLEGVSIALDRTIALDQFWEGSLTVGFILTKMHFTGGLISAEQLAARCVGMSDDTARRKLGRLVDIRRVRREPGRRGYLFAATPEAAERTLNDLILNGWDYRKVRP